ncbi:hypothetical protein A5671_06945 [Mycolicibacter heraklionensis]|nr:hypothetical protein A5671_06945 [Mycolicibacter heraklionensis]
MNTRKLRHFVVVAEELHFSRAATILCMTQQALSREIKEIEASAGAKLLDRTTRKVTLTPAGEIFLAGAREMLATLDATTTDIARAVRGLSGTLRLGFGPGGALELTGLIVDEFRRCYPGVDVTMREFPIGDPSAGLASGVSDVALLRLPVSTPDIETESLFVDPVVAMVSANHRLAACSSVSVRDLIDEPITVTDTTDESHRAFWCLDAVREDATAARRFPINSVTEEAQLVQAGMAVAITSAAVTEYLPAPGVRCLPIDDWPGSVVAVAWLRDEPSPLVARFVEVACAVRDREADVIRAIEGRLAGR